MEADPAPTRAVVEAYIFERKPLDPESLRQLGAYASSVLTDIDSLHKAGTMSPEQQQRAEQLRKFSDSMLEKRWQTAQNFFDGSGAIVVEPST